MPSIGRELQGSEPQHDFRIIAVNSCVSCSCLLNADMADIKAASNLTDISLTACLACQTSNVPPRKTRRALVCCVHPLERLSQEYLLYFVCY